MSVPHDLYYTSDHEWVRLDQDDAVVGITRFAADALGDIVYLQLPSAGEVVAAGSICGELESTKSVSDLVAPVNGEVTETNQAAIEDPALVNLDPYGAGWLLRIRLTERPGLLDAAEYSALIEGGVR